MKSLSPEQYHHEVRATECSYGSHGKKRIHDVRRERDVEVDPPAPTSFADVYVSKTASATAGPWLASPRATSRDHSTKPSTTTTMAAGVS